MTTLIITFAILLGTVGGQPYYQDYTVPVEVEAELVETVEPALNELVSTRWGRVWMLGFRTGVSIRRPNYSAGELPFTGYYPHDNSIALGGMWDDLGQWGRPNVERARILAHEAWHSVEEARGCEPGHHDSWLVDWTMAKEYGYMMGRTAEWWEEQYVENTKGENLCRHQYQTEQN